MDYFSILSIIKNLSKERKYFDSISLTKLLDESEAVKQLVTVLLSLAHLAHLLSKDSKTPVSHKNKEWQDFITEEIEKNTETALAFLYKAWLGGGGDIDQVEKASYQQKQGSTRESPTGDEASILDPIEQQRGVGRPCHVHSDDWPVWERNESQWILSS